MRFEVGLAINLLLDAHYSAACNDQCRTVLDTMKFLAGIVCFHMLLYFICFVLVLVSCYFTGTW